MTRPLRAALAALCLAALGPLGCDQAPPQSSAVLDGLPRPDTITLPPDDVRRIAEQRALVERLSGGAATSSTDLADAIGQLGQLYHAHEFIDAAITCFTQAAEHAPNDIRWPYFTGYIWQGEGSMENAADSFARVLDVQPAYAPARYRLGETQLARNRPADAQESFARILRDDPSFSAAHFGLGRAAAAQSDFSMAIEEFEAMLRDQPDATRVHYPLGLAYRGAGDLEQARRHLRDGGEGPIRLDDPIVASLHRVDDGPNALDDYRAAVEANPANLAARHNLAVSLLQSGDTQAASEEFREILAREPGNTAALVSLGNIAGEHGDLEEAVRLFHDALRHAPDFKQARFNLAQALAGLGRWPEAAGHYDALFEIDPRFASVADFRAIALIRAGRYREAATAYGALVEVQPESTAARLGEVEALWRLGNCAAARQRLDAGRRDMPRSAGLAEALARLLATCPDVGARDGALAVTLAEDLLAARPSARFGEILAMALAESGRFDEAQDLQSQLIAEAESDGEDEQVPRLRANLEQYRASQALRLPGLEDWAAVPGPQ